jgi:hypothetical protein
MLHEQQQMILIQSNVQESTHVLLVNTPYLHLHNFNVTGVSSGLSTGVTLTQVFWGMLGESITW